MRNSTGATDSAFEKLQTNSDRIKKAVNDVKNTFIILGGTILDTFAPIISGLTEKIQALCSWISSLPTGVQQIIVIVGTVIAVAGPLLVMLGSIVTAIGGLAPVISMATTAFAALTAGISLPLAPIGAVVAALVGIGLVIADLYQNNDAFRENIQVIWEGIKTFLEGVLTAIQINFSFVWDAISLDIQNIVIGLKDGIVSYFTILNDGILNLITNVLYPKLIALWESIKTGISQKVQSIKQDVTDKFNQMVSFITGLAGRFFDAGVSLFSNLWDGMLSIWDSLWSWLDDCVESVKDALSFWRSSKDEMDDDADGSHAGGLDYVPFDGYRAILHKGERVLTARENKTYNAHSTTNNGGNTSVAVTQNFYNSSENTARKEQKELQRTFRKLGLTGV